MSVLAFPRAAGECVFYCLSTDTKPSSPMTDWLLFEINTGKIFRGESSVWVEQLNSSYSSTSHDILSSHNGFPGGTTNFLRADGTFASPPGGSNAFPIGSVFIAVVSTNPATLLGYGTWSAFGSGRVLVGFDSLDTDFDTAEETGGAKTITLDTTMIPAHTHIQNAHNHTQDSHSHTQAATTTATGSTSNRLGTVDTSSTAQNTGVATATNQAATATNQNTGGGLAHNNVQPYIVVYMWKRTA